MPERNMFCCLGCVEWFLSRSQAKIDLKEWDEARELITVEPLSNRQQEWPLSMQIIIRRHLPQESKDWTDKQILEAVMKITHLRLDTESIEKINFIHLLNESVLTNIYLQNIINVLDIPQQLSLDSCLSPSSTLNCIKTIENLDSLPNLQYLSLSNNKIEVVENLSKLKRLAFLDLSENLIEEVDVDELPENLMIINLTGNPCTSHPDYRGRLIQDLPNLSHLDGQEVTKQELQECGYILYPSDNSDDSEDLPNISGFCAFSPKKDVKVADLLNSEELQLLPNITSSSASKNNSKYHDDN